LKTRSQALFPEKRFFCLKADSGGVFQRGFGLLFSCGLSFFAGAFRSAAFAAWPKAWSRQEASKAGAN